MTEKEALTRVITGNFGGDYGFDLQLLVDAVGIIGEMFKNGQIREVVRCKDCIHWDKGYTEECGNPDSICFHNGWCKPDWSCAGGERRE